MEAIACAKSEKTHRLIDAEAGLTCITSPPAIRQALNAERPQKTATDQTSTSLPCGG